MAQSNAYSSSFSAADQAVIESLTLPYLKAPLLRWGSSTAQGNGEHGQRCVFLVGPDVLIGPFSGGPVCRPYEGNRNLILHPARAAARVAPTFYESIFEILAGGSWTRPYGGHRKLFLLS